MNAVFTTGTRFLAAVTLSLCAAGASAASLLTERPGGKDHPLISRYEGGILYDYGSNPLGTARLVERARSGPVLRPVEGRISNRLYWGPKEVSALAVFRNYQQALHTAGFETLFSCETAECEKLRIQKMIEDFPREAKWVGNSAMVNIFNNGDQRDFHYISARKQTGSGFTYVQVALAGPRSDGETAGRTRQFIQVVEPAQAEMGKVTVDAKAIGAGLQRDGKIALYGVHFDTNKAVLKEESAAQLQSMADALKAQPAMKVLIVGHTDNQGEIEANLALSQKRAQAVVDALGKNYGVAANRLNARGVASFAPVSSNASEEGRAKNRRVEMVVR
ncbi:OmpA family protein [Massilia sp. YIM B02769]|uniref:OmpA family protein n=1 Tax=Massilia sp. YIM B02769 TaxID=3050129 RepID=UPI0025B68A49|nr:OmpA family protein [Massilia sp. YIM B02769]MDN4060549.1 OmpA family protein [Massilia sp. YIM B02769]